MLPSEPIRGKTFDEYLEAAWHLDEDGQLNIIAEMVLVLANTPQEIFQLLPRQIQVYRFEQVRTMMLEALTKDDSPPPTGPEVHDAGPSQDSTH